MTSCRKPIDRVLSPPPGNPDALLQFACNSYFFQHFQKRLWKMRARTTPLPSSSLPPPPPPPPRPPGESGKRPDVVTGRGQVGAINWCRPLSPSHSDRVPGEIKRREVELDPQVSPEEIMGREVELGCKSWTSFASGCSSTAVQRTLSL